MEKSPAITPLRPRPVLRLYKRPFVPIAPRPAPGPVLPAPNPADRSAGFPLLALQTVGIPGADDTAIPGPPPAIFRAPAAGPKVIVVRRPIKPSMLRTDGRGAQARRQEVDVLTAGRTAEDERCHHRIVLLLLAGPVHGPALRGLRDRLPSWNAVSDLLGLARARPNARARSPLSQHIGNDPELQRRERAEAYAQLKRRRRQVELAREDQCIRDRLVQRLQTLTAAMKGIAPPPSNQLLDWQDDFVLAASQYSVAERSACMWQMGAPGLAAALGAPSPRVVHGVLLQGGGWRKSAQRRIEAVLAQQQARQAPARPGRVADLRARLAGLVAATAPSVPAEVTPLPDCEDCKPAPDILFEPQQLDTSLLARRPGGGEWLDGLDTAAARLSERSWRHFEHNELLPARLPKARWPALRQRLESGLCTLLAGAAVGEGGGAQGFDLLTTLDDGEERGMGVAARTPMPCFEPLFFYGGSVCLGAEAARAYRLLHPQAWRYAMEVGLASGDGGHAGHTGDTDAPTDATCFGYPQGNLATRINARRLLGSDTQRQRAANVTMLSVVLPGLPFVLPLVLTRQAVAAGEELFLDYGRAFGRFVQHSLAELPRWPTVKTEPRVPEVATLTRFVAGLRALPPSADRAAGVGAHQASLPVLPPDMPSCDGWLARLGWELRPQAAGGDSYLHALEGRWLEARLVQQLRHDLADVIARWPDTAEASWRNGLEAARALDCGADEPADIRPVTHALHAERVRVAGQPGGLTEARAWCQLEDERRRARPAARGRPQRVRVAVLTPVGRLWRVDAAGCRPLPLAGLDAAERDARLMRTLREADVALLREGKQFSEIVWAGAEEAQESSESSVKVPAS